MTNKNGLQIEPGLRTSTFVLLLCAVNLVIYQIPLYRYAIDQLQLPSLNAIRVLITLTLIIITISVALLSIISILTPFLLKPICIVFALVNSIALYFMMQYNVILDRDMMGNVLNTRSEESTEFLHYKLILFIALLGVIPAWLIGKITIGKTNRLRILANAVISLVAMVIVIYLNSVTWLWFDKHSKQLGGQILPWSYVINITRAYVHENKRPEKLQPLPPATITNSEKTIFLLVIGETARANNFKYYGYHRDTNPKLRALGATALANATACSTYTTASIYCMLSHTGKKSGAFEVLPNYLQRHDIDVIWRSNNWGEPPLTVSVYEKAGSLKDSCVGEYCDADDLLLVNLNERIDEAKSDKVLVVVHVKGSHGPSYHTRYPDNFNVFLPVCKSVELNKCSQNSLINAYDNTILYTDDFLSRTINLLKTYKDTSTVLLYASDHGESLGEFGVYLHGTPYSIAPDVQKDIPFIVWMSDTFIQAKSIDSSALQVRSDGHSHSHIFHSVMGALDVKSDIYIPELDLFNQDQ